MNRVLITGAGGPAAYNFIQSLRHNPKNETFYLVGVDTKPYHLELSPVDVRYIVPPCDHPTYVSALNQIIKKERIDFIHPQPDPEVHVLSINRHKIKAKTLLPQNTTIELCQDKMALNVHLRKHAVSVPDSLYIHSEKALVRAMKKLAVNGSKVWLRATKGAGSKASLPVTTIYQAKAWIDYWRSMKGLGYGDFMTSEFLPGKEYAFQSVWDQGTLLMSQVRERQEYVFGNLTPSGQSSSPSVAMTVHNQEVNELCTQAVLAIDHQATGVFCVDTKTDNKNVIKVTEINLGRFFTTSYFFSQAGANMPYYYVKLGIDGKVNHPLKPYNNIPAGWYWIRNIDIGYKLVKGETWTSKSTATS